jgi:hypothetical protein
VAGRLAYAYTDFLNVPGVTEDDDSDEVKELVFAIGWSGVSTARESYAVVNAEVWWA